MAFVLRLNLTISSILRYELISPIISDQRIMSDRLNESFKTFKIFLSKFGPLRQGFIKITQAFLSY